MQTGMRFVSVLPMTFLDDSNELRIWVDADACPKVIKEIIYRAAKGRQVRTTFVANSNLTLPRSPWLHFIRVGAGFDVADKEIARLMGRGDLVITADIPLAAEVIELDGFALNPRGEFYSSDNVRRALSMRNFMDELRGTGTLTGGPAAFSHKDRTAFANQLDRFLTKHLKSA
jgi:hypothetical protein